MTQPYELDLLVLGGGCAGLSLASQLSTTGLRTPKTLMLEQRNQYKNDRTWCFWADNSTSFSAMATHQWSDLVVQHHQTKVRFRCAQTPYRMLPSDKCYADASNRIHQNPQIQLKLGVTIQGEPIQKGDKWLVETNAGTYLAKWLVDTRPMRLPLAGDAVLWQSFLGQEIECVAPVFDPSSATLMDFSADHPQWVSFTYILPLSTTRALIEFTVFSVEPLSAHDLSRHLTSAVLKQVGGASFSILRSEHGILPMGFTASPIAHPPFSKTYIRAGLSVGAGRAATGYAFLRIQRWAKQCAHSLANGVGPVAQNADSFLLRQMDRIFLQVIRHQPLLAPYLFSAMFSKVKSERMIRFLSDDASFLDCAAVVCALPFKPFLAQITGFRGQS